LSKARAEILISLKKCGLQQTFEVLITLHCIAWIQSQPKWP
jgi:hypothetical protein